MPYDLSKFLVIGISSSALFDLEEEDRIFRTEGLQAFIDYQHKNEEVLLKAGSAYSLVKGLLGLNDKLSTPKIEVILMSRNHPDVSLRVFNSIRGHGVQITRAALTGGEPLAPYLKAFNVSLFLSRSSEDVQAAANQGIAAAVIYSPPPESQSLPRQIRIAFDGDCVLFSDEAQKIHDREGLLAFYESEQANAKKQLPPGPFAKVIGMLSEIQGPDPETSPIRVAVVTDRNMPAHERALRTLRSWNIRPDAAFFLGGIPKAPILSAFGANMFFDDKPEHCELAARQVPTGRVLLPAAKPPEVEVTVKLSAHGVSNGIEQFLLISKTYLKRDYPASENELKEWYQVNVKRLPDSNRSNFFAEFEVSAKGTPTGSQRRAIGPEDSPKAKLFTFLSKLLSKYRPE